MVYAIIMNVLNCNTYTRYCTVAIWAVVLLLSENRAIINDLDE